VTRFLSLCREWWWCLGKYDYGGTGRMGPREAWRPAKVIVALREEKVRWFLGHEEASDG